jgi:hypothetical protein
VHRPRDRESAAIPGVEAVGDISRQLQVLALVVTDRHLGGIVEQDVRGHQHRVGEQRQADRLRP